MTRHLFDDGPAETRTPLMARAYSPGRQQELFAPVQPRVAVQAPPRPRPVPVPTLANRRFLLNDRRVMPDLVPGRLALHVAACSMLNGHLLWLWQVERYARDLHGFGVLVLARAVPVSMFPGAVRWLHAGELVELPLSFPLATNREQEGWLQLPEITTALAAADAIRSEGPDSRIGGEAWQRMDAAASVARTHPDDRVAGVVLDRPDAETLPETVIAVLRRFGASQDALRTMLTEMGVQSDDVGRLLR